MATDPIRPTDTEARTLARTIIDGAYFGALGVLDDGNPLVTRVAIATDDDGCPFTLVSDLSLHTRCLRKHDSASLLLGEPGPRGDPLTHPRLTLSVRATFVDKTQDRVERYLAHQPKAKLYIDFTDFHFISLAPLQGYLNGGFGKAFRLTAGDLHSLTPPGGTAEGVNKS